ncbi:MAG TPA: GFA family protein [Solirubrobacteraceae bacterium]|nr:GFA family protein [Solirubrobacteraceae bacterium]
MTATPPPLRGACGCGAVRFEITSPLLDASYCHCTRCQRRTGTAASANARVAEGSFQVIAGAEHLSAWRPEGGAEKWFCARCGSALFSRRRAGQGGEPERLAVRLGAIEGDPGIRPSAHQFVAYAASWEELPDDGLPRHQERAPG